MRKADSLERQPVCTRHGMFIIGLSLAKHHMALVPEQAGILRSAEEITQAGQRGELSAILLPQLLFLSPGCSMLGA